MTNTSASTISLGALSMLQESWVPVPESMLLPNGDCTFSVSDMLLRCEFELQVHNNYKESYKAVTTIQIVFEVCPHVNNVIKEKKREVGGHF